MNLVTISPTFLVLLLCSTWTEFIIQGSTDFRDASEWSALDKLIHVKSARHLAEEFCDPEETVRKRKLDAHIPERQPFVQSEYLSWPLNVNVFEQICHIAQDKPPSVPPCTNHSFQLLQNVPETCKPMQPVDLLVIISSDVANYEQRDMIRRLWANKLCWLGAKIKHIFFVEATSPPFLSDSSIAEEQEIYNDIVQQEYVVDTEKAASYKLLFGLQWFLSYCPQAKWLLFVNDDQFVNPFNMVSFLLSISEAMHQRLVVGSVWYEPYARPTNVRWQRDIDRARPGQRYPTFAATSGVLISSVLVPRIYITMRFTELTEHPDLFLAHALRKLFILPAHFNDFYAYDRLPASPEDYERAIIFPGGGRVNQTSLWEQLKCENYCQ